MSTTEERLYDLLPAVVRSRDVAEGEPLRALLAVLQTQFDAVEADIDGLYENWFIETCDEWVVPYIGDLLRVRALHPVSTPTASARAVVAHTLGYRRRKGTASMLEQLARDVTGWDARGVEFFELLGTTQHVNHPRPDNTTLELRDAAALELVGGPFEHVASTAEVRSIARRGGKYDIQNVGLFLWRLQSYPLTGIDPRAIASPPDGRFTFDVLGRDTTLFNVPRSETEVSHLAKEWEVPGRLRRRPLDSELRTLTADPGADRRYFPPDSPVFQIVDGGAERVPSSVVICDLRSWARPDAGRVAVDPVLGRIAFPAGELPADVLVDYSYGFPGDLGGGPYDRSESAGGGLSGAVQWQIGVSQSEAPVPGVIVGTLAEAVQAWNTHAQAGTARGVIAILDSRTYEESLIGVDRIEVPAGCELLVVAAAWPAAVRPATTFVADARRPHVRGDIEVHGAPGDAAAPGGRLMLNGLLIEGAVNVVPGDLGRLALSHSTLAWGHGGLTVEDGNDRLAVDVDHAILPRLTLPAMVPSVSLGDSIVGDASGAAVDVPGAALDVQRTTVIGTTTAQILEAANSLFTGRVWVERRQEGCVRFSFVPRSRSDPALDSRTPRRYRCQPDLALHGITDAAESDRIRVRVVPQFTSTSFGHPAFAQLAAPCPIELRAGAEDGSEMGAFSSLDTPLREANLVASLPEYLRLGLEAGSFYVT